MLPAPGNRRDLQACISAIRYGPFEFVLNGGNTHNQVRPAFGEPPDEEICLLVRLGPGPPLERLSEFASVEGVDGFVLENAEMTDAGYLREAELGSFFYTRTAKGGLCQLKSVAFWNALAACRTPRSSNRRPTI